MSFVSFPPVFDKECLSLILGSFPSVKSREASFYYGNRQNRFWGLLEEAFGLNKDAAPSQKSAFLLRHHIALWDVVRECEIKGSADSSLICIEANKVDELVRNSKIKKILCNGATAYKLLNRYFPDLNADVRLLPSTSPANVRFDRAVWLDALKSLKNIP